MALGLKRLSLHEPTWLAVALSVGSRGIKLVGFPRFDDSNCSIGDRDDR